MVEASGDGADRLDGAADSLADGPRDSAPPAPIVLPLNNGLAPSALAVIVNVDDPSSVAIGSYYQKKRDLPCCQRHLRAHPHMGATITSAQFAPGLAWRRSPAGATPPGIQAYALAFTQPYEVQCMSITSAFAFGFDMKWCNTTGGACGPTAAQSPYYGTMTSPRRTRISR